jgi:hypothetical protein
MGILRKALIPGGAGANNQDTLILFLRLLQEWQATAKVVGADLLK